MLLVREILLSIIRTVNVRRTPLLTTVILSTAFSVHGEGAIAGSAVQSSPATPAQARTTGFTGKLVRAWNIQDTDGEHLLVLSTWAVPSGDPAGEDRIDILATLFGRRNGAWHPEWKIADGIDCHNALDKTAEFKSNAVTITDLDNNGMAEVTVPYTLFCGGGIDDSVLKVIMRQGAAKFALRGTTQYANQRQFGGEMKLDPALALPANSIFARHLKAVRDRVYLIK